jgi:ubiquinone biosynthesis protein
MSQIWTQFVPVDFLVPESARRWRPIVEDAFQYIFTHLSEARRSAKLFEQMQLPAATPTEIRLLCLISRMPGLQKVGQVLARNRRLPPALRRALTQLENGMSDVTASEIRTIIEQRLGGRLQKYSVKLAPKILSEASVSAVIRFTWSNPGREPEEGVFKVMKPFIPDCFAEDMKLLRDLGERHAVRDVREILEEARLLLEHELDFTREQATLEHAARMYRSSFGIRVPRLIRPLCAEGITAMSAEAGVKVTAAFRRWPIRRERIAEQLIEALIAVPFFSREASSVFHADPHAGNLLYDEPTRQLIVLDWALAERLDRESRRQLVLLAVMTMLRNPEGVVDAIEALAKTDHKPQPLIRERVQHLFEEFDSPGVLQAMMLLDELALEGVRFPAALFLFRKVLFTLDGVLHDVAGHDVRIDQVIAREFLTRAIASLGLFHAPLKAADLWSILAALPVAPVSFVAGHPVRG